MIDDKNKKIIKQVGKTVGISTGIGAGIGAAGALINKKIKKKREISTMSKEAFNLVNDTFEKVAGLKEVLTGKNIKQAVNDVKGGSAVLNNFKKNLKFIEPSARQSSREAIGVMGKDLNRMKGRVLKEGTKTVGTYAGTGAAAVTGAKALVKKKEEKTAFDVVNDVFEKIAGDNSSLDYLKSKSKNGTNFNGEIKNIKEKAPSLEDIKSMASKINNKGKAMSGKTKVAIGAGLGTTALAGGALTYNKLKNNKEEKTAFNVVNDTFEKIAEAEEKKEKYVPGTAPKDVLKAGLMTGGLITGVSGLVNSKDAIKNTRRVHPEAGRMLKREMNGVGKDILGTALRATPIGIGSAAAMAGGINLAKKLKDKHKAKKEEKTAAEIVNDIFEKIEK